MKLAIKGPLRKKYWGGGFALDIQICTTRKMGGKGGGGGGGVPSYCKYYLYINNNLNR